MSERTDLERLEQAFDECLELDVDARDQVIARLRSQKPDLAGQLERLLEREGSRPETGVQSATGERAGGEADGTVAGRSDRVGPYRLVERIGKGGMGEVFKAQRADGAYQQDVAVKFVRSGFVSGELLRRFQTERQILARLAHPNVARLLDGGVSDDGAPFLVMELVDGEPITTYCDQGRLSIRRRLDLFVDVCRAVAAAHRRLIIHRDLKPSNILVNTAGEVKLLDFGVAKLLADAEQQPTAAAVTLRPLLTPEYASPEQVRGESPTTATDVYQLGLLLHELLAGGRAQDPRVDSWQELQRTITREPTPRPSVMATRGELEDQQSRSVARGLSAPIQLRRMLRGDLDQIAAKAVQKDPSNRYASADHLADDLLKYRQGLPVDARPPTVRYRVGRFLRRHRVLAVATLAVVAALATGLVVSLVSLQRARVAESEALGEAALSESVTGFLVELFQINDPDESLGETFTAKDLLDRGAERIAELSDQPAQQLRLLRSMSLAYRGLGTFESALDLAREELAVARQSFGPRSLEASRALVRLGEGLATVGQYDESRRVTGEALAIAREDGVGEITEIARTLAQLGRSYAQLGQYDEASTHLGEALALQREASAPLENLRVTLTNLGVSRMLAGDLEAAEALLEEAMGTLESQGREETPAAAAILINIAIVKSRQGDREAAIAVDRRALAIREKTLAADHPLTAVSLNNLASRLIRTEEWEQALPLLERALAIREKALGPEHPLVASVLSNIALIRERDDLEEALRLYRRALAIAIAALGESHPNVLDHLLGVARASLALGDSQSARDTYERALVLAEQTLAPTDPFLEELRRDAAAYREAANR